MRAIGYSCRLGAHALVICGQHQNFMTITEYIRQRRLSHVEMLLATTDFSIAQVAAAVGYRSDGRFCRAVQRKLRAIPGGVPADGAQFWGMPKMNGLHINPDIGLGLVQCALYLVKRLPIV